MGDIHECPFGTKMYVHLIVCTYPKPEERHQNCAGTKKPHAGHLLNLGTRSTARRRRGCGENCGPVSALEAAARLRPNQLRFTETFSAGTRRPDRRLGVSCQRTRCCSPHRTLPAQGKPQHSIQARRICSRHYLFQGHTLSTWGQGSRPIPHVRSQIAETCQCLRFEAS